MNRFIRLRLLAMLLCLPFLLIFISGCGSSSQKKDEPPVYSPLQVLVPEATGKETIGSSPMILDVSNISQGYFIAQSDSSDLTCSLQIISPSGALYSYFIAPGESATVTFTEGSGDYTITGYQQVQGDQYAALYSETVTVQLENDFLPFLYPNQYVNFTPDSKASQLALSLIDEDTVDVDALQQIYDYVVSNLTYDYEKADTVTTGYLPDVDETLKTGTGICFDYAGDIKHAWIDVYIRSKGWVNQAVSFKGDTWTLMDPTFDSNSDDKEAIQDYIGDESNYTVQFTR